MADITPQYTTQAIDPDVLSLLDVSKDGNVVSAQTWTTLWNLVFQRINNINTFCLNIDTLRLSYEEASVALQKELDLHKIKYEALDKSFVHYGEEPPTNEHIKFWIKPVPNLDDSLLVTYSQLQQAMAVKVDKTTPSGKTLQVDLDLYVPTTSIESRVEHYYADVDVTTISAGIGGNRRIITAYTIPAGTNITVTHTRGIGAYDGTDTRYTVRAIVTTDAPWLVSIDNAGTTIAKVANLGQFEVLADVVNGMTDTTTIRTHFHRAANVDPVRKNIVIKLPASGWAKESVSMPYSQVITTLTDVTVNSRIDPSPAPETLASWIANGYVFMTANKNTVVRAYSVGNLPTEDVYMPITITEVSN